MLTLFLIATLFVAVIVDSLILYYPVYPNYIIPKNRRNSENNVPPRIFPRDPNLPSSGIVFLKQNSTQTLANSQAPQNINEQKLHSDRSHIGQQKLITVNKSNVSANNEQSNKTYTRFHSIYDTITKQFVTHNELEPSRKKKIDKVTSKSKSYHYGTTRRVSTVDRTTIPLVSQLTAELNVKPLIPFGSHQRSDNIISKTPHTRIMERIKSGNKIFIIDSDAIIKPL